MTTAHVPPKLVGRLRAAGCVFAEDEARLLVEGARSATELDTLVQRRIDGEPLEQVLGWVEFCGLRIQVRPGVFVPRRRTEVLARQAALHAEPGAIVVDLCCGAGAIGAALRALVPSIDLHAADVDPVAVGCALGNLGAQVYLGDLYSALPSRLRGDVSVLVANAPYVPTEAIATMPPEARVHEPRAALDGGERGLDVLRQVIAGAPSWLAPRGRVLFEAAATQVPELLDDIARAGLAGAGVVRDEETGTSVVSARRS